MPVLILIQVKAIERGQLVCCCRAIEPIGNYSLFQVHLALVQCNPAKHTILAKCSLRLGKVRVVLRPKGVMPDLVLLECLEVLEFLLSTTRVSHC